ncbi:hypothetical protein CRE_02022 [Caenorhabditis remanei]|uniref:Uncharacterized protein n=1 Tax=Caenorhabditis remanei TaxID=31234 RepID=E3LGW0_CAERE|nr:hypothetical protein CRE_02022 [Caenorhabditis remanei]
MPPRKNKTVLEIERIVDSIDTPLQQLVSDLKRNLYLAAKETAKSETDRVLKQIPKEYQDMPIAVFLQSPPSDLFEFLVPTLGDLNNRMSTLIEESNEISDNVSANPPNRDEIISPTGHVFSVPPILHPEKPFREPREDEEIAFSINGTPLVLEHSKGIQKKFSRKKISSIVAEVIDENVEP